MAKNLPAMWETWVRSLGWENPLGEGMATHFSILAWRIARTEEPGRLWSIGSQRVTILAWRIPGTWREKPAPSLTPLEPLS